MLITMSLMPSTSRAIWKFQVHWNTPRANKGVRGCLHHGPWSRSLLPKNMWLVVALIPRPLWFTLRKKMSKWPWSLRSLKCLFKGIHCPLSWSNGFYDERGKRGISWYTHQWEILDFNNHMPSSSTFLCLISVGYHFELRIAITFYWECLFFTQIT